MSTDTPPLSQPFRPTPLLVVRDGDAEEAAKLPPTPRLRFMPGSEDVPLLAVVDDTGISLGRSGVDSDFIAQFRPRSITNDGRSRRISRAQARFQYRQEKLRVSEPDAVNPTLVNEAPVKSRSFVTLPVSALLAGEYALHAQHVPTTYPTGRQIQGWPATADPTPVEPLKGSVIVRPNQGGVLPCEVAMVLSDVVIHLDKYGRPKFGPDDPCPPTARIHRIGRQFWMEILDIQAVMVGADEMTLRAGGALILLQPDIPMRLGRHGYTIQAYSLPVDSMPATEMPGV